MKNKLSENNTKEFVEVDKYMVVELFTIIYNEGIWDKLSNETKLYGELLYSESTGNEFKNKSKEMNLSLLQHFNAIEDLMPIPSQQSSFWKIVVKITWTMLLLENNPLIVTLLKDEDHKKGLKELLGGL